MGLSAGRFDQIVRVERPTRTRNEFGEEELTEWTLIAEAWARVEVQASSDRMHEIASGARAALERYATFTLRAGLDVRPGDRLIWNGEAYGVDGLASQPRHPEMIVAGRYMAGTDGR